MPNDGGGTCAAITVRVDFATLLATAYDSHEIAVPLVGCEDLEDEDGYLYPAEYLRRVRAITMEKEER